MTNRFTNDGLAQGSPLAGIVILAGGLSTRMGSPKALLTLPNGDTLLDYHVSQALPFGVPVVIADNNQGFNPRIDYEYHDNANIVHVADYQPQTSSDVLNKPDGSVFKHPASKHSAGPLGAILAGIQYIATAKQSAVDSDAQTACSELINKDSRWVMVLSCDSLIGASDVWQHMIRVMDDGDNDNSSGSNRGSDKDSNSQTPSDSQRLKHKVYCLTDNERLYPLLGLYRLNIADDLKAYLDAGGRRVMEFITPIGQPLMMPTSWHLLSNLNTPEQFQHACQPCQHR